MISWERVRELRDEIGEDDFCEVVDLFLEEVEEVLARLRAEPNPASYEADLHFLKGSALNLGFQALGALCRDGEVRAAAKGDRTRRDRAGDGGLRDLQGRVPVPPAARRLSRAQTSTLRQDLVAGDVAVDEPGRVHPLRTARAKFVGLARLDPDQHRCRSCAPTS